MKSTIFNDKKPALTQNSILHQLVKAYLGILSPDIHRYILEHVPCNILHVPFVAQFHLSNILYLLWNTVIPSEVFSVFTIRNHWNSLSGYPSRWLSLKTFCLS